MTHLNHLLGISLVGAALILAPVRLSISGAGPQITGGLVASTAWADDGEDKKKDSKRHQETTQPDDDDKDQTTNSATTRRLGRSGVPTNLPTLASDKVAYVQAGATGLGSASDEDCQKWANVINILENEQKDAAGAGNTGRANELATLRQDSITLAQDEGCFIIY